METLMLELFAVRIVDHLGLANSYDEAFFIDFGCSLSFHHIFDDKSVC